jgi:hypothetical protein
MKPLRIFRVDPGKPPIAGMIPCRRVNPTPADPGQMVNLAYQDQLAFQGLPIDQRAIHSQTPLGPADERDANCWTTRFASPADALIAPSWMPAATQGCWERYFGYLKIYGTPVSTIIVDDESLPAGIFPWHVDFSADLLRDPAVRKAMPAAMREIDPQAIVDRTYGKQTAYAAYLGWLAQKKYDSIQQIRAAYRRAFGADVTVVNYGDVRYPTPDINGWALGVCRCLATSPYCYPGWHSLPPADLGTSVWERGLVAAENQLRAQNRADAPPCFAWSQYVSFVETGSQDTTVRIAAETDGYRRYRIAAAVAQFRSIVRQVDTVIYWEHPHVDPQADAIIADEIARAAREVKRRVRGLALVNPGDTHIQTDDVFVCKHDLLSL